MSAAPAGVYTSCILLSYTQKRKDSVFSSTFPVLSSQVSPTTAMIHEVRGHLVCRALNDKNGVSFVCPCTPLQHDKMEYIQVLRQA